MKSANNSALMLLYFLTAPPRKGSISRGCINCPINSPGLASSLEPIRSPGLYMDIDS